MDERFLNLGFTVGSASVLYVKELSRWTMLVVEGERKKGYATYRYTFYKVSYLPNGNRRDEKVYLENASPRLMLQKVTSFLTYINQKGERSLKLFDRFKKRTKQINVPEVEKNMSQPLAEQFLSGFIPIYINVINSNEAIEERRQNLKEYMIQSDSFLDERNVFYQMSDTNILEKDGLVNRKMYKRVPPKVEYSLTELGYSLKPVLKTLCDWGGIYAENTFSQDEVQILNKD